MERIGLATTNLWNSVNGGLIEMMGAVQHSFVQDLADIQRLNQQWQAESAQEANFDDIINGQQLVEDPSTGQLYEAPYSSYDSTARTAPAITARAVRCSTPSPTSLSRSAVGAQGDGFYGLDVALGHPEVAGDLTELGRVRLYLGLVVRISGRGEGQGPAETPVVNDVAAVISALTLASRTEARDRLSSLTSGLISLARPV